MSVKNNMSFKGGSYKGMDLTFGKKGVVHGGILIRSIMDMQSKEYIEGPCNTLDRILKS
jgi:hypothetical protein